MMPLRNLPPAAVSLNMGDIAAACVAIARRAEAQLSRFREEFGQYLHVRHVFLASSGRAALMQILCALANLNPGKNEVLLPAYTCFSVPSAVVKAGLAVSLYDLDPDTLSPDIESLKRSLSSSTLAVVACHLYGYPVDMAALQAVVRNSGAFLIDNAAQAIGATYRGKYAGTMGDAGLFSLNRGKNITTVEGGVIVTDSDAVAEAVDNVRLPLQKQSSGGALAARALTMIIMQHPRLYGIPRRVPFLKLGEPAPFGDFSLGRYSACQAAMGSRILTRLPQIIAARGKTARCFFEGLSDRSSARFIKPVPGAEPIYLRLPILSEKPPLPPQPSLGILGSYPTALHEIEKLRPWLVSNSDYPAARAISRRLRTLPTHRYVRAEDVKNILAWIHGHS